MKNGKCMWGGGWRKWHPIPIPEICSRNNSEISGETLCVSVLKHPYITAKTILKWNGKEVEAIREHLAAQSCGYRSLPESIEIFSISRLHEGKLYNKLINNIHWSNMWDPKKRVICSSRDSNPVLDINLFPLSFGGGNVKSYPWTTAASNRRLFGLLASICSPWVFQ